MKFTDTDRHAVDTIRVLAMDAVQRANSGHPGMPMAMAPVAYLLYTRFMSHNPADPSWPDRDRFVLSAGHGSMLLYAALHLTGYELPLEELENFRQWGSLTPGHPEHGTTPGVETTTGPLGQGFANGVGMAMAERFLRERYGEEVVNHRTFAICSDGDLMEGLASEAASLAGHLGLGGLVYLYDDNEITIDGSTELSFSEEVDGRFSAYGWQVLSVEDANDLEALSAALDAGCTESERPTLIRIRSVIGYPAPNKQGTPGSHGAPLGEDEVRATKEALGFDPERSFQVSDEVYAQCDVRERGQGQQTAWAERFEEWRSANPELAGEWDAATGGKADDLSTVLPQFSPQDNPRIATRSASGEVIAAVAPAVPTMLGGAADLACSVMTDMKGESEYTRAGAGRNVHWGVREHAMAGAVNGMALHGGIVKPFGATFLIFSDYMRPSVRLSALMELPVVWVFSHDSLGVGEDGPTHQPVEQLAALRAIPGLTVIRPADATETAAAWRLALEELDGPVALALTRQAVSVLDRERYPAASELRRGAYVLSDRDAPTAVLVATGSEVELALDAQRLFDERDLNVRVISMPSWELFERQEQAYRDHVLPPDLPKLSVEAGVSQGWERYVDRSVAIDRFGASAPGGEVLAHYGFTVENVVEQVDKLLNS